LNLFKSRGNRNNLISLIDILILDFVFFNRNSCDSRSVWLLRNWRKAWKFDVFLRLFI
jgi:hypothetical protein